MEAVFLSKLGLSFLVGGLYAIISTVFADRLGTKIGGMISALPSTTLFGLLFIAWTQSPTAASQATTLVPAMIGIACLFLITYVFLIKHNVFLAIIASLIVWAIATYVLIVSHISSFIVSIVLFAVLFIIAYIFITDIYRIKSKPGKIIIYTPQIILIRGLLSGFVVALSVYIAKIGGPVLGGMFTSFPAMLVSTLLITYFTHGAAFSAGITKSSLFGWISILVYVIFARFTYASLGIVWGTLLPLLACYVSAYLLYRSVLKRIT